MYNDDALRYEGKVVRSVYVPYFLSATNGMKLPTLSTVVSKFALCATKHGGREFTVIVGRQHAMKHHVPSSRILRGHGLSVLVCAS